MKALSIRQPWASFIINGVLNKKDEIEFKDIENRDWETKFKGVIYVHAGIKFDVNFSKDSAWFVNTLNFNLNLKLTVQDVCKMERGGIIGQVNIIDCVKFDHSKWFEGVNGLVLANPKPLKFKPCKGMLGFFDVEYP